MQRSTYKWGLKLSAPSHIDKHLKWNDRMKALELMVPSNHEEPARLLVSSLFSPDEGNSIKIFSDCYLFIGMEREKSTKVLAPIFSAMVSNYKFRITHLSTILVKTIVKFIHTILPTRRDNVFMSLREMIQNLSGSQNRIVSVSVCKFHIRQLKSMME